MDDCIVGEVNSHYYYIKTLRLSDRRDRGARRWTDCLRIGNRLQSDTENSFFDKRMWYESVSKLFVFAINKMLKLWRVYLFKYHLRRNCLEYNI